jgi:hypothetical protein
MPVCNFRLGQKVVCIDAGAPSASWHGDPPKEGEIYTIRAMQETSNPEQIYLFFHEIRRGEWAGYGEVGYYYTRFRALEERKSVTDISVFKKLLDECKEPV